MADVLRRDRSQVMAAGVLPDRSRVKVRAGVLPDNSRVRVRVGVLPDRSRAKVRADVLPDNSQARVRVGVLPDNSRVMALAVALRANQAAVDALQDHRPVKAAEGAMVAADKAAGGKADTEVGTTSSRAAVNPNRRRRLAIAQLCASGNAPATAKTSRVSRRMSPRQPR
jgi:hypothetical protein